MNYNYFRSYNPATGRYTQSDPIGLRGGLNQYSYVLNSPTILIDPLGNAAVPIPMPAPVALPGWLGPAGGVAGAAAGGWWLGSQLYPHISEPLGDLIDKTVEMCRDDEEACPPCKTVSGRIVPVGTIAYRPLDVLPEDSVQHGIRGSHYNIYRANQAPKNSPQPCKCFWQPVGAVSPSELPPGAIPIEPFAN